MRAKNNKRRSERIDVERVKAIINNNNPIAGPIRLRSKFKTFHVALSQAVFNRKILCLIARFHGFFGPLVELNEAALHCIIITISIIQHPKNDVEISIER